MKNPTEHKRSHWPTGVGRQKDSLNTEPRPSHHQQDLPKCISVHLSNTSASPLWESISPQKEPFDGFSQVEVCAVTEELIVESLA